MSIEGRAIVAQPEIAADGIDVIFPVAVVLPEMGSPGTKTMVGVE